MLNTFKHKNYCIRKIKIKWLSTKIPEKIQIF